MTITTAREPEITVDNIEVAQFVYLLLHNQKIRDVIDTFCKKVVLILGRFTRHHRGRWLNNWVEQDHRRIKRRVRPMLGFKRFETARCTLAGIEAVVMLAKGQV